VTAPVDTAPASRRVPRWAWAVLALAVAVGLVAAGVALREVTPALRLSRAPDATIAAGTAGVAVTTQVAGLPIVRDFTLDVGRGDVDFAAQQARVVREIPGVAALPFVGAVVEPVEVRFDAGDVYVRLPVAGERRWVRVRQGEGPVELRTGGGLGNPAAVLGLLQILDGGPEEVGEEPVREVTTSRFRIVVDLDEAIARLGDGAAEVARGIRLVHGEARLPMEVWLDDRDRVRRLRYATSVDLAGFAEVQLTTDLELFAFGGPVDTAPPDAEQLVTVPDVRLRELDPLGRLRDLLDLVPGRG
jgi:hypothetical protein